MSKTPSSPTNAYAGLSLNTRSESMSMPPEGVARRDSLSLEENLAASVNSDTDTSHLAHMSHAPSPPKRPASHMDEDDMEMRESIETDHADGTGALAMAGRDDGRSLNAEIAGQEQADATTASNSIISVSGSASAQASSATTSLDSSPFHMTASSDDRTMVLSKSSSPRPPYDEQYRKVLAAMARELNDGEVGYIISTLWLSRILARTSQPPTGLDKSATEGEIGPVDNADIQPRVLPDRDLKDNGRPPQPYIPLKPGALLGEDFEIVPADAWDWIKDWYGVKDNTTEMRRYAHETTEEGSIVSQVQYELSPPILTLRRVKSSIQSLHQSSIGPAPRLVVSRSQRAQNFLQTAKSKLSIPMQTKVKVWRILESSTSSPAQGTSQITMMTPPTSDDESTGAQLVRRPTTYLDVAEFESLEPGTQKAELEDLHDRSNDANYNGSATVGLLGLGESQTLIFEEVSTSSTTVSKPVGAATKNLQARKAQGSSERASPAPSGTMTRGRAQRSGRGRGTVGLQNLGNTCYMNSALQCIRSVEELSQYFLSDQWKKELNPGNPLGHSGNVAKVYAALVNTMYESSAPTSFAPRNFKQTLGRYAPMFSGYGQQDSQEFMSFLVDGLHEDLNRIQKKPYIENPESDDNTVGDQEAIRALGEKFRENHRARNDSIAMDLFNGFYKNTMVCPICDKVSITFDPFSLLTLQLPFEQTWQQRIWFMSLYGPPICIDVDMDKNGSIRGLKEYIMARIPGLARDKLIVTEIFNNKFYKIFEDNAIISESNIQGNDKIAVYELEEVPTNWPPKKKPSKAPRSMYSYGPDDSEEEPTSEMADRMLVPIFHHGSSTHYYHSSKSMVLWPLFISLTPEEATDYDTILKKVLARAGTLSTKKFLEEEYIGFEQSKKARNDSDEVVTAGEEGFPIDESTVQDTSLDDDASIVNVSVVNGADVSTQDEDPMDTEHPGARYRPSPPAILKPSAVVPGPLQNLFTMRRYHAGKEIIPSGMTVGFDKTTPIQPPRRPVVEERRSSVDSSDTATESSASSLEEENDEAPETVNSFQASGQDEHDDVPEMRSLGKSKGQNKYKHSNRDRKGHGQMTYSKKGKHTTQPYGFDGANDAAANEEAEEFIRLGDAIILEWSAAAMDTMFNGTANDELRGQETWKNMEVLDDPALRAKQAKRTARKKAGVSLEECFAETSKSEILSEENAWYCSRCKELRRASKTLEVWTLPEILVVHLKRFGANRGFRDKLEVLVDFPVQDLDLNDRVGLPEGKDHTYDLFAVDNHYGGLGGGHYTAYAKNFLDGKWYDYNDSSVTSVSNPDNVVTSSAYLLFYRRKASTPLGPEYLRRLVDASHKTEDDESHNGELEVDNDTSRNASPSGQGKGQPGGSYPNGSPSVSARAGAGPLVGSAQDGLRGGQGNPVKIEDETMLDDFDEGYSESGFVGPQPQHLPVKNISDIYRPLWDFKNAGSIEALGQDADEIASNAAAASDTAADADMEDGADDEDLEVQKINVSPDPFSDAQIDDLPTADIHLDEDVEDSLDNDAHDFPFRKD